MPKSPSFFLSSLSPDQIMSECILVDKIYAQCQKRVCSKRLIITRPNNYSLSKVVFHNGSILSDSLVLNPVVDQPNYIAVRFEVSVPYTATFTNTFGNIQTEDLALPNFSVNTILYHPVTRNENNLNIKINTHCTLISMDSANAIISVDINLITSVVAQVQLLIPSAGFCEKVGECEEYIPPKNTSCKDFLDKSKTKFPADFYPFGDQ